ncbi:ABC sorbitol/mannitol transporter, ATPase subunit [Fulvimarina pelagi HTCC2506]|uniref:ABC sorbitol/mannitol transporter, ATPase subunit n=1 Tax=Fulvimarina pelagi HTCC2506 TaxID=314231 RepID=Q0G422_9HYPH|nr:ABC sorbitol/mannitol transporter, ATPase subunit [Fulvimarina pelagi HTCC2506]
MIYVTHDQVEAMTMADKIVVLRAGNIEQVGSPLELYTKPRNTFVAGFIGSPKMNLMGGSDAKSHNADMIGVRPEHIDLSQSEGQWKGEVKVSEHLGSDTFLHVQTSDRSEPLTVRAGGEFPVHAADTVYMTPQQDKIHRFDGNVLAIR